MRHHTWRRRAETPAQCHKPGSTKSSQHLEWISRDTGGPCWRTALPLYFWLQIEKQNRHQGYIYITVFKLHFYSHLLHMISFKGFSNKRKKMGGQASVEGRHGDARDEACRHAPYLVRRLSFSGFI